MAWRSRRQTPACLALIVSLIANLILLSGVLYLKVPAVHEALLPLWRSLRGVQSAPTSIQTRIAQESLSPSLRLAQGQIHLSVSADKTAVNVTLPPLEEVETYVVKFDTAEERQLAAGEASFVWALHDGGSRKSPNHVTVWEVDTDGQHLLAGELDIYRVAEEEGLANLGVRRPDGWLFVGRCTFNIEQSGDTCLTRHETAVLATLTASERSLIASLIEDPGLWNHSAADVEDLLANLGRASSHLCECGLKYVSPVNNALLYAMPPSKALAGILRRDIGVQCQGFRSVFVWSALSCGWLTEHEIREVDLARHDEVAGLDTSSHAILEILNPAGGWLAVDPLAQVVFADEAGQYLSAERIALMHRDQQLEQIRVVRLSEPCASDTSSFAYAQAAYWSESSFDDRDSANYNYWCVFSRLLIRSLQLPD